MPTKIQLRNRDAFRARYVRDDVAAMTTGKFGDWVDALPMPEFMAMMDLSDSEPRKYRRIRKEPKPARIRLCKALAGIAAFNIQNESARMTVYRAIRELQRA